MATVLSSICMMFLILAASAAECPVSVHQQTKVFSGSVSANVANNQDNQNLSFEANFDSPFNSVPQLGFGITEFSSGQSPVLEIKIVGQKLNKNGLSFEVKSGEESQWESLRINFITSTRSDMELGTAIFTNPEGHMTTDEVFEIAYPITKNISTSGLKVKPFIQSFDIESTDKQSVGIKLADADIEDKKIYFEFANPNRTSLVRSMIICVVLFSTQTPGVLYADGIIDQNYVTSKSQILIPRHGIKQFRTHIVGINSFHASVAQKISISAALSETFTLVIGPIDRTQIEFVSVSYLILSIIECGNCQGYPVLFEGICQVICPIGYTVENGECVKIRCADGFEVGIEGKCVPECGDNAIYIDNRCQCLEGFGMIGDACIQCPIGTKYNERSMTCDSICDPNSYYFSGKCICYPGYNVIGNRCVACPKGTRYNQVQQKCQSICKENEAFDGEKCICITGYNRIDGICDKCPDDTNYNSLFGRCDCLNGKQFSKQLNKCIPICNEFEKRVEDRCQCKDEFYRINGACGICPEHSFYFFEEQKCYCKFGFRRVGDKCQCPEDRIYDDIIGMCVKRCTKNNQAWVNGECTCRQGEQRDEKGFCYPPCGVFEERINGICRCINGYHKGVIGPCVEITCPPGFQWNPIKRQCRTVCPGPNQVLVNDKCECVAGFQRELIYGICLPACPNNQVRMSGKCVCSAGNKIIDGVCTNCPRYSQYVNGVCLCYDGNVPIDGQCQKLSCPDPNHVYDSISKSCKCKGPLIWMMGKCHYIKGCGQNQYWCGTKCACHYGYTMVHGKCVKSTDVMPKCPPYSTFDPVQYRCICQSGYHPVSQYTCQMCPAGAYWDGHKCNNDPNLPCAQGFFQSGGECVMDIFCGPNEYLDAFLNCRCKTGYFFINGECMKCEYGQYFDGTSCVNFNVPQCTDPYKVWNGVTCVCMAEFFQYGDTCVRCPANTKWNGLCCKIPSNLIVELNVVNGY